MSCDSDSSFHLHGIYKRYKVEEKKIDITSYVFVIDPPAATGMADIVDWSENMVKLKWDALLRDGGAPITGFIVEFKDRFGTAFTKAVVTQGPKSEAVVPKLEEGCQYQFRKRSNISSHC